MGQHHRIHDTTISTQVRHPWRATLRTVLVTALAIIPLLPEIAAAAHIDTIPAVVSVLTIAAAVQRIITTPHIDALLKKTLLSAQPRDRTHHAD